MSARDGKLTLAEALAISVVLEQVKPEPTPDLIFAAHQAQAVIRDEAAQAMARMAELHRRAA